MLCNLATRTAPDVPPRLPCTLCRAAGRVPGLWLVPAPTAATSGPQNSADLVFGLLAVGGGGIGFLLTVAAGILGLVAATTERRNSWVVAICVSGGFVVVGLAVSAFVLLGLPRSPYHPFTVLVLLPLTTLAFYVRLRQTSSPPTA